MLNAPKTNLSMLTVCKYCKSTKRSIQRHPQANEGKSGLKADSVQGLGSLRSLRSGRKLAAAKWQQTDNLSNEENEKWIEVCVDRETAVATKRDEDAQTAIMQEQEDMRNAEKAGLTTRKPEITLEEMLKAIGDVRSDLAYSYDGEDREDDDYAEADPEWGQAERRWWTRLGAGHNLRNDTASHGAFSAEADEAWLTDDTRLGRRGRLLLWER